MLPFQNVPRQPAPASALETTAVACVCRTTTGPPRVVVPSIEIGTLASPRNLNGVELDKLRRLNEETACNLISPCFAHVTAR